jgi:hypothetical protein
MGFVGVAVALIIGILIYSEIEQAVVCPEEGYAGFEECNEAKGMAWMVISILPIALFFAMFAIFSGIGGTSEDEKSTYKYDRYSKTYKVVEARKVSKSKYEVQDPHINDVGSMLGEVMSLFKRGDN